MIKNIFTLFVVAACCIPGFAEDESKDLGYRFVWDPQTHTGKCLNKENKEGYNPYYLGQCGDFRGMSIGKYDINGKDIQGSNMDGINLRGVHMNGAFLRGISAKGTNFSKTQLNGAKFSGADLSGANFIRAELNGAELDYTNLSGAIFDDAQLHGTQMNNANLSGTKIATKIETVNLKSAKFSIGTALPIDPEVIAQRGMVDYNNPIAVAKKEVAPSEGERKPANK